EISVLRQFQGDQKGLLLSLRTEFFEWHVPVYGEDQIILMDAGRSPFQYPVPIIGCSQQISETMVVQLAFIAQDYLFGMIRHKGVMPFKSRQELCDKGLSFPENLLPVFDQLRIQHFQQIHIQGAGASHLFEQSISLEQTA